MIQIVFVHGVNNRDDEAYRREVAMRDDLLRRVAFAGHDVMIRNPFWGKDASTQAWGGASLPGYAEVATFSLSAPAKSGDGTCAEDGFEPAVDKLFAALVEERELSGALLSGEEIAQFSAAGRASRHAPNWFRKDMPDHLFIANLAQDLASEEKVATLPLGNPVARAAQALTNKVRQDVSDYASSKLRRLANERAALLIGDAFVYLKAGEKRDAISATVTGALRAAFEAAQETGGRLVVIGHSFGGVIVHDVCCANDQLPDAFAIDLFVTVGSQPGLFEEFKLFDASDPSLPRRQRPKAPRGVCVRDWMNVYDPTDLLAFRAEPIFDGCKDYAFRSGAGFQAHTAYFKTPQFHDRLSSRLRECGILA